MVGNIDLVRFGGVYGGGWGDGENEGTGTKSDRSSSGERHFPFDR